MHATTENISVEREITIAASPETVWELLVDPSPSPPAFDLATSGAGPTACRVSQNLLGQLVSLRNLSLLSPISPRVLPRRCRSGDSVDSAVDSISPWFAGSSPAGPNEQQAEVRLRADEDQAFETVS